jgi:hypothetical protein
LFKNNINKIKHIWRGGWVSDFGLKTIKNNGDREIPNKLCITIVNVTKKLEN